VDKAGRLRQKGHPAEKWGEDDGGGPLLSPDGVSPSQMIGVSTPVMFPCTIKVQKKISSGTQSPG